MSLGSGQAMVATFSSLVEKISSHNTRIVLRSTNIQKKIVFFSKKSTTVRNSFTFDLYNRLLRHEFF